jgi:diacylglycerol kinase family enzyme
MKHLFIINPQANHTRGKVEAITESINAFFSAHPNIFYDIYITKRCRDSILYIRRYITRSNEITRIHAIGGIGTLFEVVNSVINYPNVEVASYPYGGSNCFIRYFGDKHKDLFLSFRHQILGEAIPMDVIRCGGNYGLCYGMTGIEGHADVLGEKWVNKGLTGSIAYPLAAVLETLRGKAVQRYFLNIDGREIDGFFASVLIANAPCYGTGMNPAIDAHPDDGIINVYTVRSTSVAHLLRIIPTYTSGNYRKIPDMVKHYKAKKVKLSSDSTMCISIDGEHFYGLTIDCEVIPGAIRFVCPEGIDIAKLPILYGKPKEGLRGGEKNL